MTDNSAYPRQRKLDQQRVKTVILKSLKLMKGGREGGRVRGGGYIDRNVTRMSNSQEEKEVLRS